MLEKLVRRTLAFLFTPFAEQVALLRQEMAAIHRTEADRKKRGAVAIEFSQQLVDQCRDWSEPVGVRFVQDDHGNWDMHARSIAAEVYQQTVASRAARQ